ncbi:Crp/Fnr family transcriptional regulator [Limibacterium fermenti]|uniref:Crp/Fnr family transcriptional regulator n=1 Tax=Limibacterium fermenti TaxID=3229863 RepID=UPI003A6B9DE2
MTNQHSSAYGPLIFKCPLCSSIPPERREEFLQDVRYTLKRYGKGDMLFAQGAEYKMLYILIQGEVRTEMSDEKGDFMEVAHLKAPNPLAPAFLFADDNHSPVTAIGFTDCAAILIPKENVYFLIRKYDAFRDAFLMFVSNKVVHLTEKLRLVSLRTIRAKLAYYILKESKGERVCQLKISKQDLAHLFGVSRPALVNVMMQLAEEGIIGVDGRTIDILRRGDLQRML